MGDQEGPLRALVGEIRHWCEDLYDERFHERRARENPVNGEESPFACIRGYTRLTGAEEWFRSRRQFGLRHALFLDVGFRCVTSL